VKVLGEKLKVKSATEPTNIIWENREFTKGNRLFRYFLVIKVVAIILACSFTLMVSLKKLAVNANSKYLKQDCREIELIYGGGQLTQDYAVEEWFDFYQPGP
jgi:hypothetical protein